jgi:hypothetical protein
MSQNRDHRGRFVTDARLNDGLANVASGAGLGADKRSHSFYIQPFMLPEQIEAAYRSIRRRSVPAVSNTSTS